LDNLHVSKKERGREERGGNLGEENIHHLHSSGKGNPTYIIKTFQVWGV